MDKNQKRQLNKQMEDMASQVRDLEMKARYWKAQFEIRHFTLQAEKLQEEYDQYLEAQAKLAEEARENMLKEIEEAVKKQKEAEIPAIEEEVK